MKENRLYYNKGRFFNRIVEALKNTDGLTVHQIADILKNKKTGAGRLHKSHPSNRQIGQILNKFPHFDKINENNNGITIMGHSVKINLWKLSELGEEE